MRPSSLIPPIALALMLAAGPALAQHEGHGPPPAPQATPEPPAAEPAPDAAADPETEAADAMTMDWPTDLPADAPAGDSAGQMDHGQMDHGAMDHGAMDHGAADAADYGTPGNEPPPPAPTDYAAEQYFPAEVMKPLRDQLRREHGGGRVWSVMLSLAEGQWGDGDEGYRWQGEARYGGDLNRVVVKTEGEGEAGHGLEAGEVQLLYSRAIGPYYDLQAGIRQDIQEGPRRTWAVIGFEGLAPYWFETEGALFLSDEGELSGRLEASYDLRLTQRWILEPRAEVTAYADDIPELDVGAGVSSVELGLRLRYEIRREFAPYVGVNLERKVGDTADLARALGDDVSTVRFVAGVRTWF